LLFSNVTWYERANFWTLFWCGGVTLYTSEAGKPSLLLISNWNCRFATFESRFDQLCTTTKDEEFTIDSHQSTRMTAGLRAASNYCPGTWHEPNPQNPAAFHHRSTPWLVTCVNHCISYSTIMALLSTVEAWLGQSKFWNRTSVDDRQYCAPG